MLTLISGRAGTGKTAYVLDEIKRRGEAGETDLLLIVPEQYSHDAERQLCAVCGDRLAMYGETLSFSRLCERVFSETGGAPAYILDGGGRILVMRRALESVASGLRVFGTGGQRAEQVAEMLDAIREFKSLNISPEKLSRIADTASKPLCDKLHDLSLIFQAYDAILHLYGCDSMDRLTLLADKIGDSAVGDTGHLYFDGFNDFTAQELRVIEQLLKKKAGLTVCLTYDEQSDDSEVFDLPRRTAERLKRLANESSDQWSVDSGQETGDADSDQWSGDSGQGTGDADSDQWSVDSGQETGDAKSGIRRGSGKAEELVFLEKYFFGHDTERFPGQCRDITVCRAPTPYTECEHAAFIVWKLAREGYRWRDIGVMARNWESYGSICENIFEKYDIPFFSSGRADILDKPLAALIDAALEIAVSGWEYKPIFRYLKTGLSGVMINNYAELENYVLKWKIRGSMWTRDWTLPPYGRGEDSDASALVRLNGLRQVIIQPLAQLRDGIKGITEADVKLRAIHEFFLSIKLPGCLAEKADKLEKNGDFRLANEYAQLWGIVNNAVEQFHVILGDTRLGAADFRKLFSLTLSRYDVGVIPISLDRTALGDMAMSRRRDLKCLIILGATDDNLPMMSRGGGVLSDSEREELSKLGAEIPAGVEERFSREMNILYSTLTLPSSKLFITYPTGGNERPSYIVKRIVDMFDLPEISLREKDYVSGVAEDLFLGRGKLSEQIAERLYGSELSLSSSRVDRYYSCPYQHFLKSGLRLEPRIPAEFDAPVAGSFMHYVLERVSREINSSVGFNGADEELCRSLTKRYIEQYIRDELFDFEGKTERFIYIFRRLEDDVLRVVTDMLSELKKSEFEPLDFELDFLGVVNRGFGNSESGIRNSESRRRGDGGDDQGLVIRGTVDRVDGWEHDGKLYLRVIDYKTGKMTFNLPDILNGRNMQMLIYLFALQEYGGTKYGMDIAPAGVLYVPARDVIMSLPRNIKQEDIERKRESELRRSGLVLNDPFVLDAMESGDVKKYLPVKITKDGFTGDSLANPEQIALLSEHIGNMLRRAAAEIQSGVIECMPYYKNEENNACLYCEYYPVCAFDENSGDKRRVVGNIKASEVWEILNSEFGVRS